MEGTVLSERYRIDEKINAGGMGYLYRGTDQQTNTMIAIKQLKPEIVDDEQIERFKREGEALRDLNHPNIVKMLDAVQSDGNYYLIMEYISGGDLSDLLKQERLSQEQLLTYAIDLADALTRAHKLEIVHRDLKPANVLIGEDGVLRLTDFGVARLGKKAQITETGATVGTFAYMAPEVLNGDSVDARSDIWSFGVMLFEMLSGELPFDGYTMTQLMLSILQDDIPNLELLAPDAPLGLIDLIYRMLDKNPNSRIVSVRYVGAELEDISLGRENTPTISRFETQHSTDAISIVMSKHHNLPAQTTEFVGRESELIELGKLLAHSKQRLVTVLAPGGMGKTRLALQAAQNHLETFEDGVFFVDLTPINSLENIASIIADATGFQLSQGPQTAKQQVLNFLANKNLLLLMDNWEHIVSAAGIITEILQSAPDVQILATSRLRLEQPGETLFHLSGMDFPEWETPEDALSYAAVKLFMNSAKRAQPSFELDENNLESVARICRLVGGMPLGIVLAASWLSMLSPEEIAQEITRSIDFLQATGGEVPERQSSIQAIFEYSWNMLTPIEQAIYAKMSVFKGGFTRESAQAVTGASLRQLMSLVNKSLIRRDVTTGRYSIHELARQYAGSQLKRAGLSGEALSKHFEYFSKELIDKFPRLGTHEEVKAAQEVEADYDNFRQSWQYAVEHEELEIVAGMTKSYQRCFDVSWRPDYIDMFTFAHDKLVEKYPDHHATVFLQLRKIEFTDLEFAERELNRLLDIAQTSDNYYLQSLLLNSKADIAEYRRQYDLSELLLKDAYSAAQHVDTTAKIISKYHLAHFIHNIGDLDKAATHYKEAFALAEKAGTRLFKGHLSWREGILELDKGNLIGSKASTEQAISLFSQISNARLVMAATRFLVTCEWLSGNNDRAHQLIHQVIDHLQQINDQHSVILTRLHNVITLWTDEHYEQAQSQLKTSQHELGHFTPSEIEDGKLLRTIEALITAYINHDYYRFKPRYIEYLRKDHFWLDTSQYFTLRWFTLSLAYTGDTELSIALLSAIWHTPWITYEFDQKQDYINWLERVKADVSQDVFDAAWQRGSIMSVQDVSALLKESFGD